MCRPSFRNFVQGRQNNKVIICTVKMAIYPSYPTHPRCLLTHTPTPPPTPHTHTTSYPTHPHHLLPHTPTPPPTPHIHTARFNQNFGTLGVLDRLHGTDAVFRRSKAYDRHVLLLGLTPVRQLVPEPAKQCCKAE